MKETKVIGIAGEPHSGKTTFARIAQRELIMHGFSAEVYNVSDGISAVARAIGAMNGRNRDTICKLGELFRFRDPTVWLKVLDGKIADDQPEFALVPGLRLRVDLDWLRTKDFALVITRRYSYEMPYEPPEYKEILNIPKIDYATNVHASNMEELTALTRLCVQDWI